MKKQEESEYMHLREEVAISRVSQLVGSPKEELSAEIETLGYSNIVFKITSRTSKYLYKEYLNKRNSSEKWEILWQKFLGSPKILFETDQYRIDEYIDHSNLNASLIQDKEILSSIAYKLSQIHILIPPPNMRSTYFEEMVKRRIRVQSILKESIFSEECIKIEESISNRMSTSIFTNSTVLAHNDLQFGNILVLDDKSVVLVDFEHMAINSSVIEIANLFNELSTDYSKKGGPLDKIHFVDRPEAIWFIKEYINIRKLPITPTEYIQEVKKVLDIPQYYWFIWAIEMILFSEHRTASFDYQSYALKRLKYIQSSGTITTTEEHRLREIVLQLGNQYPSST
ncbi:choline/ethanolamine kinase [Nematocida sp. AWRm80]|nr:choline/ethanolamine kinase [Nematocida sp. AWRm80]